MKLNPKCIRDVLLTIEDISTLSDSLVPVSFSVQDLFKQQQLKDYSDKEIVYTVKKLSEAGYVKATFKYASDVLYSSEITELTYEGHQFLNSISNSQIFDSVMKKIDELGSGVTLEILKSLATKLLKEKLGL